MRFVLYLILAFLCLSCAYKTHSVGEYNTDGDTWDSLPYWQPDDFPLEVYIDDNIEPSVVVDIMQAASRWNERIGEDVFTYQLASADDIASLTGRGYVTVVVEDFPTKFWIGFAHRKWDGANHMKCVNITISPKTPYNDVYFVALHEFGHALNLGHDVDDKKSIMYPKVASFKSPYIMRIRNDDANAVRDELFGE